MLHQFVFTRLEPDWSPDYFGGFQMVYMTPRCAALGLDCLQVYNVILDGDQSEPTWITWRWRGHRLLAYRVPLLPGMAHYSEMIDIVPRGLVPLVHGVLLPGDTTPDVLRRLMRPASFVRSLPCLRALLAQKLKEH